MNIVAAIILGTVFIAVAFHFWNRFAEEEENPQIRRWLVSWACKGMSFPVAVWFLMNIGVSSRYSPVIPEIADAQMAGKWFGVFMDWMGLGLFIISSWWAAMTLIWLVATIFRRVESRNEFFGASAFWSFFLVPIAMSMIYYWGWSAFGVAILTWFVPVVHFTLPLVIRKKVPPIYSRAVAKMKFGKYEEAELEVIQQLEKCEDDFDGWMMLAELYANQFKDLPTARRTICETCGQPNVTGSQLSVALHRLADWELNLAEDPVAARNALEIICQRLTGTHLDKMARLRIQQLPATREELLDRRKTKTFHLPALNASLDEAANPGEPALSRTDAARLANACVERLKRNPNDVSAREELARIFAEQLEKVDLALEQIELLLGMPEQPAQKAAEWLALMAAWQLRYRHDQPAAQKIMKQIVREYPQSAQAFAAERRLKLMEMEERIRQGRTAGVSKWASADPLGQLQ